MAGEKTEKATPKRRQDERKKGNIFQSKEIPVVATLLVTFYSLKFLLPISISALEKNITKIITSMASTHITTAAVMQIFIDCVITVCIAALPVILITCFVAIVAVEVQTRGLVTFDQIKFKMSKLNPLTGIKNMFSSRGLMEIVKSILKIGVVLYILYSQFKKIFPQLITLMDMSFLKGMAMVGDMILSIVQTLVIIFVFLAVADYAYEWFSYEKKLKMSKQEIKEEYKQQEGDPQIKGKIRERQQAAARRRMMQDVPTADVVIRNPTHLAIAIRYKQGEDVAPKVVAKGADALALRIVEVAKASNVFTVENKPLAHGLYDAVELDQFIPVEFYTAIAELLAQVYKMREAEKHRGY